MVVESMIRDGMLNLRKARRGGGPPTLSSIGLIGVAPFTRMLKSDSGPERNSWSVGVVEIGVTSTGEAAVSLDALMRNATDCPPFEAPTRMS